MSEIYRRATQEEIRFFINEEIKKNKTSINYSERLKKCEFKNPNKMIFESSHKTFNKKVKVISTGNVISDTQTSWYIAGSQVIFRNNLIWPKDYLRNRDLEVFNHLPNHIRRKVLEITEGSNDNFILYHFFHYNGKEKVNHGYILTTATYELKSIFLDNEREKTESLMLEAAKYISWNKG